MQLLGNTLMLRLCSLIVVLLLLLSCSGNSTTYDTITDKGYFSTLDDYYVESESENTQVNTFIDIWLSNHESASEEFLLARIRRFICKTATYRDTDKADYSVFGVLKNGKGCCMGYALLTKRFLDRAGVLNYLVHDLTENHLYNLVFVDGTWKSMDITRIDREQEMFREWLINNGF